MKPTIDQVIAEINSPDYKESKQTKSTRKKNEQLFLGKAEFENFLTCQICGIKARELTPHLLYGHKIDPEEYKSRYGLSILKSRDMADMMVGDKNPGFQHGGKLSPFSDKFINGNIVKQTAAKMVATRTANGNNTTSLEYWLKKADGNEQLAASMLSNRQSTFSYEICVEKYGDVVGKFIWKNRQVRWQETLNSKPEDELRRINLSKVRKTISITSIIENEFVSSLMENFETTDELKTQKILHRTDIMYKFYMYDVSYGNKIIEFNGDYWHANPKKYNKDDILYNKYSAGDIWKKDAEKIKLAKSYGYDVYIVWELDYKKNKQKVIDECLNFLRE